MKKVMYALIIPLLVVGGLLFANRETKNETVKVSTPKPPSAAEIKMERERWEATPAGMNYKKWKASPIGTKVLASAAKIQNNTNTEAVVTALTLPPGSRLGFGVMVKINGDDYILSFGSAKSGELQQLHSLKVNDKLIIKSHSVSHAPKYAYPIITGAYVERDSHVLYKRVPPKDGC